MLRAKVWAPAPTSRWWSVFSDRLRHPRGRPYSFEGGHAAGPPWDRACSRRRAGPRRRRWAAAEADAGLLGIQLEDVDAGDQRVQHVAAAREQAECLLDTSRGSAILETIAVGRRNDDRLGSRLQDGWRAVDARGEAEAGCSCAGADEVTSIRAGWHAPECTIAGLQASAFARGPRPASRVPQADPLGAWDVWQPRRAR